MDKKVQPKENQGAIGAGFEGRTGSNSYSVLPRSSNASLGIDPDVAAGRGAAVSNTTYGDALNVGQKEGMSSNKNLGIDAEAVPEGTQGAREDMGAVSAVAERGVNYKRGNFGVSAKSGGHAEGSTAATLGSGARPLGTLGNETGTPGQSGSMAFAMKGLKANPGLGPSFVPQPRGPLSTSMVKSEGGIKRKGNAHGAGS